MYLVLVPFHCIGKEATSKLAYLKTGGADAAVKNEFHRKRRVLKDMGGKTWNAASAPSTRVSPDRDGSETGSKDDVGSGRTENPLSRRVAYHVIWHAAQTISWGVWVITIVVSSYFIWESLALKRLLLLILGAVAVAHPYLDKLCLSDHIFLFVEDILLWISEVLPANREAKKALADLVKTFLRLQGLGFATGFFLLFALCFGLSECLRAAKGKTEEEVDARARLIVRTMRRVRLLLYFGAVLTTVGLVRLFVLQEIALTYFPEGVSMDFRTTANASTLFYGLYYTGMLAASFLPAMLILTALWSKLQEDRRARQVAADSGDLPSLADLGGDVLPRLIAVFSPLITGIASIALKELPSLLQ